MLDKLVWTESEFGVMGWHDATMWGLAFLLDSFELALDIDYIVKWDPAEGGTGYRFWIAPSTLVFHNVTDLALDVALDFDAQIDDLERSSPGTPRNAEAIGKSTDWQWVLSFRGGTIQFRRTGFTQFVRRQPEANDRQSLSLASRNGVSFARTVEGRDVSS